MAARSTKRRPAKRNGSPAVARLSALDLENIAQVEMCRYFEIPPDFDDPPATPPHRRRMRGGRAGLAPAARRFLSPEGRARSLFELHRLIRRAYRERAQFVAIDARAREEHRLRGLGEWDTPEAIKRLRARLDDFDRRHALTARGSGSPHLPWPRGGRPARATMALSAQGASRRDVHAYILQRHRSVQREIRALVARLKPKARPRGRVFRFVYRPDHHDLMLTFTDSMPSVQPAHAGRAGREQAQVDRSFRRGTVVPRDGVEPPTQGFSVPRSTD
jgi:hypothetical protein